MNIIKPNKSHKFNLRLVDDEGDAYWLMNNSRVLYEYHILKFKTKSKTYKIWVKECEILEIFEILPRHSWNKRIPADLWGIIELWSNSRFAEFSLLEFLEKMYE